MELPDINVDLKKMRKLNPDQYEKWKFKLLMIDGDFEVRESIDFMELFKVLGDDAAQFLVECGFHLEISVKENNNRDFTAKHASEKGKR